MRKRPATEVRREARHQPHIAVVHSQGEDFWLRCEPQAWRVAQSRSDAHESVFVRDELDFDVLLRYIEYAAQSLN